MWIDWGQNKLSIICLIEKKEHSEILKDSLSLEIDNEFEKHENGAINEAKIDGNSQH